MSSILICLADNLDKSINTRQIGTIKSNAFLLRHIGKMEFLQFFSLYKSGLITKK